MPPSHSHWFRSIQRNNCKSYGHYLCWAHEYSEGITAKFIVNIYVMADQLIDPDLQSVCYTHAPLYCNLLCIYLVHRHFCHLSILCSSLLLYISLCVVIANLITISIYHLYSPHVWLFCQTTMGTVSYREDDIFKSLELRTCALYDVFIKQFNSWG